jgi:hypothetical protein
MSDWDTVVYEARCCECGRRLADILTGEQINELTVIVEPWCCSYKCYENQKA